MIFMNKISEVTGEAYKKFLEYFERDMYKVLSQKNDPKEIVARFYELQKENV